MSFQLNQIENGVKVTTGLRHLGFWIKDSLNRVLKTLLENNQAIYLDLGTVSYVDEAISQLIQEVRKRHPQIQLVGYPRHLTANSSVLEGCIAA